MTELENPHLFFCAFDKDRLRNYFQTNIVNNGLDKGFQDLPISSKLSGKSIKFCTFENWAEPINGESGAILAQIRGM